jgi:hypothetical protein
MADELLKLKRSYQQVQKKMGQFAAVKAKLQVGWWYCVCCFWLDNVH